MRKKREKKRSLSLSILPGERAPSFGTRAAPSSSSSPPPLCVYIHALCPSGSIRSQVVIHAARCINRKRTLVFPPPPTVFSFIYSINTGRLFIDLLSIIQNARLSLIISLSFSYDVVQKVEWFALEDHVKMCQLKGRSEVRNRLPPLTVPFGRTCTN